MPKYTVYAIIDATAMDEVEAASPEEAVDKAEVSPRICHQCADEIEVGDPIDFIVEDEAGETVYETSTRHIGDRMRTEDLLKKFFKKKDYSKRAIDTLIAAVKAE